MSVLLGGVGGGGDDDDEGDDDNSKSIVYLFTCWLNSLMTNYKASLITQKAQKQNEEKNKA
jgi:hypothetical protein